MECLAAAESFISPHDYMTMTFEFSYVHRDLSIYFGSDLATAHKWSKALAHAVGKFAASNNHFQMILERDQRGMQMAAAAKNVGR